jgi:hypothetical protein
MVPGMKDNRYEHIFLPMAAAYGRVRKVKERYK